jgi:hypothetical protein
MSLPSELLQISDRGETIRRSRANSLAWIDSAPKITSQILLRLAKILNPP